MRILILGAKGFIGSRLSTLLKRKNIEVLEFDKDNTVDELLLFLKQADYVVHLAGINRPLTKEEFYQGNFDFTKTLVDLIKDNNLSLPIIMTSSIQAELDNDYGKSKKMAEDYRETAERNVRIRLVLEAIIKAENVLPDEEAVNKKIEDMAKGQNKTVDEYKKDMDPRYLTYLLNQSLTDTLMAKLKELNPAK